MFTPRVGRHCTFIVIGRAVRGERFCGKHPKYERPFSVCYADREDKTDADSLRFETVKYTERKTAAQKYPLAQQKCTLSGTAGG